MKNEQLELLEKIRKTENIGIEFYNDFVKKHPVDFESSKSMNAIVSFDKLKKIKFILWHGASDSGYSLAVKEGAELMAFYRGFNSSSTLGFEELNRVKIEDLSINKASIKIHKKNLWN